MTTDAVGTSATANAPLVRAEQVVAALRDHFPPGKFDEAAAERMLAYFRQTKDQFDSEREEDEDTEILFANVLPFFKRYNQSLDWVLLGRPRVMIAMLAGTSPEAIGRGLGSGSSPSATDKIVDLSAHRQARAASKEHRS